VTTKTGRPHHNTYCFVCRMENGKIRGVTEYCDTALLNSVLGSRPGS
jgi:ketosteroid isomerase-like protein